MYKLIFPELDAKMWTEINLNEESKKENLDFKDPEKCLEWINSLHRSKEVLYSYGGFLEDRSNIWKEHYQKRTGAFIHLGVDYNVPAGTKIYLFEDAVVEQTFNDKNMNGGWGGRIMFKLSKKGLYVIFGHLREPVEIKTGSVCKKGDFIGEVGLPFENGGWFPHLHVQVMDEQFVKNFESDLRPIDGYLKEGNELLTHVFDPEKLV